MKGHDNRSVGNRIDNIFVYLYLERHNSDGVIQGAGFYRIDINPDAAVGFGALAFSDWESFKSYEEENGSPRLFIVEDDDTTQNAYGL